MGSSRDGSHRMTEHEIKIIDESIRAYKNMIENLEKKICDLQAKKVKRCCFEDNIKKRLKIKGTKCQKNKKTS